jgi:ribose 5-phosphate isomerase A
MTMDKEAGKKNASLSALNLIKDDMVIGVGTGSTVDYFIQALSASPIKAKIEGAVASSEKTASQLKAIGIPILDLNSVSSLEFYIDGADEINAAKQMIKGGGGALTREKIIASVARQFICIADESKLVDQLGAFPVAIEVLPMARSYVARQLVILGAQPVYREGFVTDNNNVILDVYNLSLLQMEKMEETCKNIVGVVETGMFAKRKADILFLGDEKGCRRI